MKFKPNATEEALYKLLGVLSTLLFIQGMLVIFVAFAALIKGFGSESGTFAGEDILALLFYFAGAGVLLAIGVTVKNIQTGMAE